VNLRSLLQWAQGSGVRPAAYSLTSRDDLLVELLLEVDDVVGDVDAAATRLASCRSSIEQQLPNEVCPSD